jgi:hypothetical protein
MSNGEIVNAVVNGFVALGTLLLAVLVVYGDSLRSRFAGARLRLVLHNLQGIFTRTSHGDYRHYYLMRVVNDRRAVTATNCRVLLRQMWRRGQDNTFQEVSLPFPLLMYWSPSEITEPFLSVRHEQLVDLGFLQEGKPFLPYARLYPNTFDGGVWAGQTVRYGFEIVSDNFDSHGLQVFEVSWNGQWSQDPNQMAQNLQIREVLNEL